MTIRNKVARGHFIPFWPFRPRSAQSVAERKEERGGCTLAAMKQSQQGKEAGGISQLVFAQSHREGGKVSVRKAGSKGRSIDYPSAERASGTGYDTLYLCWRNRRELANNLSTLRWHKTGGEFFASPKAIELTLINLLGSIQRCDKNSCG